MGPLVSGLGTRGKLIVVGFRPSDAMSAFPLVFGGRSINGSLAGTAIETEDALAFSVLENIRPMIETVPLERADRGLRSHDERQSTVPHGASRRRMGLLRRTGSLSVGSSTARYRCLSGASTIYPSRFSSFLRSPSNVSLSSFERTLAASSIAAACSRRFWL